MDIRVRTPLKFLLGSKFNNVVSIYKSFIDNNVPDLAALELTNLKVAEKGWTGYVSGDNKKFNNPDAFTEHIINLHSKLYPDSLKANNFNLFYNSLESGRVKYNPNPTTYKLQLLLTRPGVKKRINIYRLSIGQQPLTLLDDTNNIPSAQLGSKLPEVNVYGKLPDWARDAVNKIKNSNTEFAQRLKSGEAANNTIPNWQNNKEISSLKTSWGDNAFIFPVVQKVNDKLIDYSNPKYNPMKEAFKHKDYIDGLTPKLAEWITNNNYKWYFPNFNLYGY